MICYNTPAESLKEHLNLKNLPLATTDKGREFVMKALHPADHEIKATRVPGGIDNTVALQVDQIFDWALDVPQTRFILSPTLETPVIIEAADGDGVYSGRATYQPPVFGGSGLVGVGDARSLVETLRQQFESYTITSESLTLEFIAPALANQGAIVAAQWPNEPQIYNYETYDNFHSATDGVTYGLRYCVFDSFPNKSRLLSGTRAYNAKLTQGCYMPLRLNNFKQHYLNREYCHGFGQAGNDSQGISFPRNTVSGVGYISSRVGMPLDHARLEPASSTWGIMYLDGYDSGNVSVRCRFRMTIEGRVYPGSTFAPLAEPPPPPDSTALKMYREIAGRLVNAYPASYNDWNKLKGSVLSMADRLLGSVAPWIGKLTSGLPFGGAIATLSQPLISGARGWIQSKLVEPTAAVDPNALKSKLEQLKIAPTAEVVQRLPRRKRNRKRKQAKKKAAASAPVVLVPVQAAAK